jgi:hypothetical protein
MTSSTPAKPVPSARATSVRFTDDLLYVQLEDGRAIGVPLAWFPHLSAATPEQRANWQLLGRGVGLHWHWPDVDEDLSVAGLLST